MSVVVRGAIHERLNNRVEMPCIRRDHPIYTVLKRDGNSGKVTGRVFRVNVWQTSGYQNPGFLEVFRMLNSVSRQGGCEDGLSND